jgi:hypothetical protein
MKSRLKLSKSSTAPLVHATEYTRIVGTLRYLVKSTTENLLTTKRVVRYVARTLEFGCYYEKTKEDGVLGCHHGKQKKGSALIGYCDSYLVGDVDTRKSTT